MSDSPLPVPTAQELRDTAYRTLKNLMVMPDFDSTGGLALEAARYVLENSEAAKPQEPAVDGTKICRVCWEEMGDDRPVAPAPTPDEPSDGLRILRAQTAFRYELAKIGQHLLAVKCGPKDYVAVLAEVEDKLVSAEAPATVGSFGGHCLNYAGVQIQLDPAVLDGQPLYVIAPKGQTVKA